MAVTNPRRVELGQLIKRAREAAGLSPADVDEALHWYAGRQRRVELGTRVLSWAELNAIADLIGVHGAERDAWHKLGEAARKREAPQRVADFAQAYVTHERAAVDIRYYSDALIYGPLQTEDYAKALLGTSDAPDVSEQLATRVARSAVIHREPAPHLSVVLGEAALHVCVGGERVLRAQLEHLVSLAELSNVDIRVIPYSVGAHRSLGVTFHYLRLEAPDIKRVYLEGLTSATYVHVDSEIAVYERAFDQVRSAAADAAESVNILRRRINEFG